MNTANAESGTGPDLVQLPFEVDDGFGARARIGLIVLESDQTLEIEARLVDIPGVGFYHARIANDLEVTPTTLTDMARRLPAAAGLLPVDFGFDAIGYGCTSAATLIGADGVADASASAHPGVASTNPISAVTAALGALGADRAAVVTPYTADVTGPIVDHLAEAGITISAVGSFLEPSDLVVARISESSVADGVRTVVAHAGTDGCDAVFVSCTSLRLLGTTEALEAELGLPVVSSNTALLWHLLRLAGIDDSIDGLGRLFTLPLPLAHRSGG